MVTIAMTVLLLALLALMLRPALPHPQCLKSTSSCHSKRAQSPTAASIQRPLLLCGCFQRGHAGEGTAGPCQCLGAAVPTLRAVHGAHLRDGGGRGTKNVSQAFQQLLSRSVQELPWATTGCAGTEEVVIESGVQHA